MPLGKQPRSRLGRGGHRPRQGGHQNWGHAKPDAPSKRRGLRTHIFVLIITEEIVLRLLVWMMTTMAPFHSVRQSIISFPAFRRSILTSGAFERQRMSGLRKDSKPRNNLSNSDSSFIRHHLHSTTALKFQKRPYSQVSHVDAKLQIELVPCLVDNYAYIIYDPNSNQTGVVDPSIAEPVKKALRKMDRQLTHILNTHHHWDHTGGNKDLKYYYGAKIVAPHADGIQDIDVPVGDGDTWMFGEHTMNILGTPGHTLGHVSFYFPGSNVVFTGDTLFSIGCGRLLEGSADQMWASLSKIADLPDNTKIYCGHEYTLVCVSPNSSLQVVHVVKAGQFKRMPSIAILHV
ncbi:hypothetical protein O6H91_16G056900 [Diphasiastrum complanatum]|uniref:Uncharacterized protein n=1 Tax=Diphasiastrum complanatum TaxID=34168 RepID=A0ACC2BCQ0_DIPCM|nr:hypothetical protein O6H91_16G056900 [Diphasiastrum complanatum]